MIECLSKKRWSWCGLAMLAMAAPMAFGQKLDWDAAFVDRSGAQPVHFVAEYTDARGPHRLEEWRLGLSHLRRRTDDRIDLHADAVSALSRAGGAEYAWQIVDLQKRIDNKISSAGMFRAGMFYSYYSMAHVLSRPAGRFQVSASGEPERQMLGQSCRVYELTPEAQPVQRICWSAALGLPLIIEVRGRDGSWTQTFAVKSVDRKAIAPAVFRVDMAGLAVRDHDQMAEDD